MVIIHSSYSCIPHYKVRPLLPVWDILFALNTTHDLSHYTITTVHAHNLKNMQVCTQTPECTGTNFNECYRYSHNKIIEQERVRKQDVKVWQSEIHITSLSWVVCSHHIVKSTQSFCSNICSTVNTDRVIPSRVIEFLDTIHNPDINFSVGSSSSSKDNPHVNISPSSSHSKHCLSPALSFFLLYSNLQSPHSSHCSIMSTFFTCWTEAEKGSYLCLLGV